MVSCVLAQVSRHERKSQRLVGEQTVCIGKCVGVGGCMCASVCLCVCVCVCVCVVTPAGTV